jgi:hypothetical protein
MFGEVSSCSFSRVVWEGLACSRNVDKRTEVSAAPWRTMDEHEWRRLGYHLVDDFVKDNGVPGLNKLAAFVALVAKNIEEHPEDDKYRKLKVAPLLRICRGTLTMTTHSQGVEPAVL